MTLIKALWQQWKIVARKIADVQARIILSTFYFIGLAPFALGMKMSADALRLGPGSAHGWLERLASDTDHLTIARRQY